MNELDMSRPGSELFPDANVAEPYNSYTDVNAGQVVDDPLDAGVKPSLDAADQGQLSQKDLNFGALREEVSKMKQEKEYWRGQAEAASRQFSRPEPAHTTSQDALSALDWDDGRDVKKAFESLKEQNEALRYELKDAVTALTTKTERQDWNKMVTQNVPELTSKNPMFAEMIQKASNPYEAAYLLAELNAKATGVNQPPPQSQGYGNAQRAIANAQKPQTLASVGGSGTLSNADYYASMSDEDFHKIAARNMANV